MPLPAPVKSWQIDKNIIVGWSSGGSGDVASVLARLVLSITSFASGDAAVVKSSDGSSVASSDLWQDDPGSLAWGIESVAHSWIQIALPGVGPTFQILIALIDSGTVKVTAFASWAGFTGGSATARPTATDEVQLVGTTELGAVLFGGGTGSVDRVLHVWMPSDGSALRATVYAGGTRDLVLHVDKPVNPVSGWTTPFVAKLSAGVISAVDQLSHAALNAVDAGYFGSVIAGAAPRKLKLGWTGEAIGGTLAAARLTAGGAKSGAYPIDAIGLFSTSTYFLDGTQPLTDRYGELADIWWGSPTPPDGSTYPNDGTRTLIQVGNVILPWDGAASFLTSAP